MLKINIKFKIWCVLWIFIYYVVVGIVVKFNVILDGENGVWRGLFFVFVYIRFEIYDVK